MGSEVCQPLWVQLFRGGNSHLDIQLANGSEMANPVVKTLISFKPQAETYSE